MGQPTTVLHTVGSDIYVCMYAGGLCCCTYIRTTYNSIYQHALYYTTTQFSYARSIVCMYICMRVLPTPVRGGRVQPAKFMANHP